ncbi:MAG: potassium transporter Kup [Betaproteobacteria bacterium]|nr:potassium transporter Kup [Betaproteobacteria bacterium]
MSSSQEAGRQALPALSLAALGVVFGDIGTSPLYAMKEAFAQTHFLLPVTPNNVYGILSLIVWTLVFVVTVKYVVIVMRADNHGEGGVIALMVRVLERSKDRPLKYKIVLALGLGGAALFYGDGVITPAISVFSAVEGLEIATPVMKPYVVPITVVVLLILFLVQRHGTARVGQFFGPVMLLWFCAMAAIGLWNIFGHPEVLWALSPHHAVRFFIEHAHVAFFALGAVFLTVTGAEALYADMGHFGKKPIRLAWACVVMPGLVLNYFGQGATIIGNAGAAANPFYLAVPAWGLLPMVCLATVASVIASQALITGAFSMTRELIQLGFCPRVTIHHTSGTQIGQIYVPFVNAMLLTLVLAVVLGFRGSSSLAAAYGIAVSMTMAVTTMLAFSVVRRDWNWSMPFALLIFVPLAAMDAGFISGNAIKILEGGWVPLVLGSGIFLLLTTWKRGREILTERERGDGIPLEPFVESLGREPFPRVPLTAVYLVSRPDVVPNALLHNLKHNMVLHETTVFASVVVKPVPRLLDSQRVLVERIAHNFYRVKIFFGFMEDADVPSALEWCAEQELALPANQVSYFLSRETLLPTSGEGMWLWREHLFSFMYRNATSAASFFNLPPNRVVEMGSQITI